MRGLKTALAAAVLAVGLALPAAADEAERMALARDVMELSGTTGQLQEMFGSLAPLMTAQIQQSSGFSQAESERLGAMMIEEFQRAAPEFIEILARDYAGHFTEAELVEMRAFFASPLGARVRDYQTGVGARVSEEAQRLGIEVAARTLQRYARRGSDEAK